MYEQIARNRRASWLLAGTVVALLAALGFVIGYATMNGTQGGIGLLGVFGVVAIVWSIVGYYSGDKMVLAVSGARRVTHAEEPQLYNVVEEMTIAAGLPQVPAVYVLDEASPNALATGRDPQHASIAVTRGLLDRLDREELQGVIAHEMSHIRNYDIRFETLVGILVGMIALIADFFLRWSFWGGMGRRRGGGGSGGDQGQAIFMVVALVLAILAPLAAYAVQFAVSRRREYLADASAVELTRNPLGLARALDRIARDPGKLKHANRATAHLYIANPLKKSKEVTGVFDTHPPISERIKILLGMAHVGPEALRQRPEGPEGAPVSSTGAGAAGGSFGGAVAVVPPPPVTPGQPVMPPAPVPPPPSGSPPQASAPRVPPPRLPGE
jgi:heat shock protein HtpX